MRNIVTICPSEHWCCVNYVCEKNSHGLQLGQQDVGCRKRVVFFDQAKILIEQGFEVEMLFVNYIFGIRNPIQPVASYQMDGIRCHFVEAHSIIPRKAWLNIPFHGIQLSKKMRRLAIMSPDN